MAEMGGKVLGQREAEWGGMWGALGSRPVASGLWAWRAWAGSQRPSAAPRTSSGRLEVVSIPGASSRAQAQAGLFRCVRNTSPSTMCKHGWNP